MAYHGLALSLPSSRGINVSLKVACELFSSSSSSSFASIQRKGQRDLGEILSGGSRRLHIAASHLRFSVICANSKCSLCFVRVRLSVCVGLQRLCAANYQCYPCSGFSALAIIAFPLSLSASAAPLTSDRDVSEEALLLSAASALRLAHVVALVLRPDRRHGEVQHPAVGRLQEGELAVQRPGVLVHALAVQARRVRVLALLRLQGQRVQAVPAQVLVGVIVSAAPQGHLVLLQGNLRRLDVHAETLRDGFNIQAEVGSQVRLWTRPTFS